MKCIGITSEEEYTNLLRSQTTPSSSIHNTSLMALRDGGHMESSLLGKT